MSRLVAVVSIAVLAASAGVARGAVGMRLDRAVAAPGETIVASGCCNALSAYLVPATVFPADRAMVVPAAPADARFFFLGVVGGDFDPGDFRALRKRVNTFAFRVPESAAPGPYRFVVFCGPCVRGPGGSLIATATIEVIPRSDSRA